MERSKTAAAATATALLSPNLNLFRALEARGLDAAALFRRAGCDPALLNIPETRVTDDTLRRLYELAERETADPCLGIDVAQQVRGTALHALGYAWLASATLGDAMARMVRYTRVLTDFWRGEIRDEPRGVRFVLVYSDPQVAGPLSRRDAALAGIVRLCRITYGDAFVPLEVTVERAPPAGAHRFDEWFRAPIVWGAPYPSILCRREDIARPLPTLNTEVVLASERLVADYLARLDRGDVVAQVKRQLLGSFPAGASTQAVVARALGLSSRTLQRRLADARTSFAELVDVTRRELAGDYLRRTDYAVGEVAYLLGFAETSSFNRAFRRWTGRSPTEFRRVTASGEETAAAAG